MILFYGLFITVLNKNISYFLAIKDIGWIHIVFISKERLKHTQKLFSFVWWLQNKSGSSYDTI